MSEAPKNGEPPKAQIPIGKKVSITARLMSMLFVGIFILGLSLMFGEGSSVAKLPFSSISITTTFFGGIGALVSELMAKRAEKWDAK